MENMNELGKKIKASENIWFAIEHIANELGADVGEVLEELVKKEKKESNEFERFMDSMRTEDKISSRLPG
jgi:hypothetical protein